MTSPAKNTSDDPMFEVPLSRLRDLSTSISEFVEVRGKVTTLDPQLVARVAEKLQQWNVPADPYFMIGGGSLSCHPELDPYVPIVRVVLASLAEEVQWTA